MMKTFRRAFKLGFPVHNAFQILGFCALASTAHVASAQVLYVSQFTNSTIVEYSTTGTFLATFAFGGNLSNPRGLAFDNSGDLFVANNGGWIGKITPGGTNTIFGNAIVPNGVALDMSGNIYAASNNGSLIYKFTPGSVRTTFVTTGANRPSGIAFDAAGNLYASLDSGVVEKYSSGGADLGAFASIPGGPVGLAFDSSGNLFVAEHGFGNIHKVTPGGVNTTFVNGTGASPYGLAFDSSNNLYVANDIQGTLWKYNTSGSGTQIASGLRGPSYIAFGQSSVPEPGAIALGVIGVGTVGMMIRKRRRSRK